MYEKHDPELDFEPEGWEEVEGADVPPWVATLGVVGYYVGRGLLVFGVVCFVVAGALLAGDHMARTLLQGGVP